MSGLKSSAQTVAVGVLGGLAGLAIGTWVKNNITPKVLPASATDTGATAAVKSLIVPAVLATLVAVYGRKYVPPIVAYGAAIGIVLLPARDAIYALSPAGTAPTFLGASPTALPRFPLPPQRRIARGGTSSYPRAPMQVSSYSLAGSPYPQPQGMIPGM